MGLGCGAPSKKSTDDARLPLTTAEAAASILRDGFDDSEAFNLPPPDRGIWIERRPFDAASLGATSKGIHVLAIDVDEDVIAPYEIFDVEATGELVKPPPIPEWLDPADTPRHWIVPADILNRWPLIDLGRERDLPSPLPGERF